jgi:2-(1,2-epoxy-1,2-dihydrophenyl)acetyl-CoA isomerase
VKIAWSRSTILNAYKMSYKNIEFEKKQGVGIIKLNRPDVLNSFNYAMAKETQEAMEICENDDSIRAIVFTAIGRAFCAGQDLAEAIADNAPSIGQIVDHTYNPIITKLRSIEKPIIGAVNGVAAGAGANIAFACDITFAATSASFIQSFSNIGLIPDSGGTYFLPRLIGMQRATAQMFLANKVKAEEAKQLGMIYEVVSDEELQETAFNFAADLATRPTKGFGLTKRALNQAMFNSLEDQLKVERELQEEAGATADHKEGVSAFLEKRKPNYIGK